MRDMGPRDRSIRNIPVPKTHRRAPLHEATEEEQEHVVEMYDRHRTRGRGGRQAFWIIAVLVVVLCAAAGFLMSILFAGASIVVFERRETVSGPLTVAAELNPVSGALGYGVMSGTRSATTTVPATGTKDVSRAASR